MAIDIIKPVSSSRSAAACRGASPASRSAGDARARRAAAQESRASNAGPRNGYVDRQTCPSSEHTRRPSTSSTCSITTPGCAASCPSPSARVRASTPSPACSSCRPATGSGRRDEGAAAELGLLVLEGLLIRDVTVADARCGELIGPGTLLRPRDDRGTDAPMRHEVGWRVVEPARLAVLDRRFLRVAAHWPALVTALVARATERAHNLGVMVSIHSLKRVDTRLLAFFWHLADRFGKVTADGVLVPLPLTHRQLALLVGAQRPSVTSALGVARRARPAAPRRARQLAAVARRALRRGRLETDDLVGAGDAAALPASGCAGRRSAASALPTAGARPIAISSSTSASAAACVRSPWRRIERAA